MTERSFAVSQRSKLFMRSNTVNGIFFFVLYYVLFPVNKCVCMYVCMYVKVSDLSTFICRQTA